MISFFHSQGKVCDSLDFSISGSSKSAENATEAINNFAEKPWSPAALFFECIHVRNHFWSTWMNSPRQHRLAILSAKSGILPDVIWFRTMMKYSFHFFSYSSTSQFSIRIRWCPFRTFAIDKIAVYKSRIDWVVSSQSLSVKRYYHHHYSHRGSRFLRFGKSLQEIDVKNISYQGIVVNLDTVQ